MRTSFEIDHEAALLEKRARRIATVCALEANPGNGLDSAVFEACEMAAYLAVQLERERHKVDLAELKVWMKRRADEMDERDRRYSRPAT